MTAPLVLLVLFAPGGTMKADNTTGLGPELYTISKPPSGTYTIRLKAGKLEKPGTAMITVYANRGKPWEHKLWSKSIEVKDSFSDILMKTIEVYEKGQ